MWSNNDEPNTTKPAELTTSDTDHSGSSSIDAPELSVQEDSHASALDSAPASTVGRVGCLIMALAAMGAGGWWWWNEVMAREETTAAISAAGATSAEAASTATTGTGTGTTPQITSTETPSGTPRRTLPIPVAVADAVQEDMEEWLTVPGTVIPLRIVTVRSRIDGELVRVNFKEGQHVKAGEVLAEIDSRPFEVALERARAAIKRNEVLLENAKSDLERYELLWKQNAISQQELATQSALVKQYEAELATERASIASAELDLTYTKITSPLSGLAGLRMVDEGNMIRSANAEPLVVITQEDPAGLIFSIPQDRAASVRRRLAAGEVVTVRVAESEEGETFAEGRVVAAENQIDAASGTLKLKAEAGNPDGTLIPNQFVMVRLLVNTVRGATVVPAGGIHRGAQGAYAYVLKDDSTVELRLVETGLVTGERIVVVDGLKPGETLVVQGADRLRDGSQVRVIDSDVAP